MSATEVRDAGEPPVPTPGSLRPLRQAAYPAVHFANKIGDSILTLPTLRALAAMFTAPLTLISPRVPYELCFHEVSPRHVDITALARQELHVPSTPDYRALASQIGAVDVFINIVPWNMISVAPVRPLRQRLAPGTSIGFRHDLDVYDVVLPRHPGHCADLIFDVAHLFDETARIEDWSQPLPIPPLVLERADSTRAALPPGTKVLAVHADTDWAAKRWPVTRFIDLLDRFLSRHPDFVAWVIGMGEEELNVGRERARVVPYLGLPLNHAVAMVATADLFVGIDSCMLHAADLARVPGVGLFGPTRSATWGFRFARHRHVDARTMADITVDQVLDALEDLATAELRL